MSGNNVPATPCVDLTFFNKTMNDLHFCASCVLFPAPALRETIDNL